MTDTDSAPTPSAPKYRALAQWLRAALHDGRIAPGQRLPSIRRLMRDHRVSLATAVRALEVIEAEGLAESRPRSGWFAATTLPSPLSQTTGRDGRSQQPRATASAQQAVTVTIGDAIQHIYAVWPAAGRVSLAPAALAPDLLPMADIRRATATVMRTRPGEALAAVSAPPGLADLRSQLPRHLLRRGIVAHPDDILITAGDGVSMELALRVALPQGGVVGVESPTYFGMLKAIELAGCRVREIATDPLRGIDLDAVEALAAAGEIHALLLNPTCQNPFGFTMAEADRHRLLALARRFDLVLIEDDVFAEHPFDQPSPRALKALDSHADRVIYCGSISKTLATGWRVGWCIPGRWHGAMRSALFQRVTGVSVLPQLVLAEYLSGRAYDRHIKGLRGLFAQQMPEIRALVLDCFPPGTRISAPSGGFLYWVEVPDGIDTMARLAQAAAAGVDYTPGPLFSPSGRFANGLRLAVGARLGPAVRQQIQTLGAILAAPA